MSAPVDLQSILALIGEMRAQIHAQQQRIAQLEEQLATEQPAKTVSVP